MSVPGSYLTCSQKIRKRRREGRDRRPWAAYLQKAVDLLHAIQQEDWGMVVRVKDGPRPHGRSIGWISERALASL